MNAVEKSELNVLRLQVRNTEALCLAMGVAMNDLKQRIRALELDSHPPINLKAALASLGVKIE